MRKSISPNESVAIIESHGMMAAARLVQLIGQETRARIVVVAPLTTAGSVTTIVAGPLAEVQHALELAREHNVVSDSAFFARPNLTTMEMLIGSALGEAVKVPRVQGKRKLERSLSLFADSQQTSRAKATAPAKNGQTTEKKKGQSPTTTRRTALTAPRKRPSIAEPYARRSLMEIERMSVHTLRRYARTIPEFPILGREISRANRSELLQMIKSHFEYLDTRTAHTSQVQTMLPS